METKDILAQIKTDYVDYYEAEKGKIPMGDRPQSAAYKKINKRLEFLEDLVRHIEELESEKRANLVFMALAEKVCEKFDKFGIGDKDILLPGQKKELAWIRNTMKLVNEEKEF